MNGYKPAEVRKALIALLAFLITVVAVILEATISAYGDGDVNTGEWLAIAITGLNAIAVFGVPNADSDPTPVDDIGEEINYDLENPDDYNQGQASDLGEGDSFDGRR